MGSILIMKKILITGCSGLVGIHLVKKSTLWKW